jgi:predicted N-acyltransferase
MPEHVSIVLAHERASGRVLGGAFNLVGDRRLFGRYWGAREDVRFLHFNVCYYQGIEECIRRGLEAFEPGAGGEHKLVRGFEPTLTYSGHWLADRRLRAVIDDFLERECKAVSLRRADEPNVLRPIEIEG